MSAIHCNHKLPCCSNGYWDPSSTKQVLFWRIFMKNVQVWKGHRKVKKGQRPKQKGVCTTRSCQLSTAIISCLVAQTVIEIHRPQKGYPDVLRTDGRTDGRTDAWNTFLCPPLTLRVGRGTKIHCSTQLEGNMPFPIISLVLYDIMSALCSWFCQIWYLSIYLRWRTVWASK